MNAFTTNLLAEAETEAGSLRAQLDATSQELQAAHNAINYATSEFNRLSALALAIVDRQKALRGGYESRDEAARLGRELSDLIGDSFVYDRKLLSLDYCLAYGYGDKKGYERPIRDDSPLGKTLVAIYQARHQANEIAARQASLEEQLENWLAVSSTIRRDQVTVVLHHHEVKKEISVCSLADAADHLFGRNFVNGFGTYLEVRGEHGRLLLAHDRLIQAIRAESQAVIA